MYKSKYVILMKHTAKGSADLTGALKHVDATRAAVYGPHEITEICHVVTMGRYDMVIVIEAASDELVGYFVAELAKMGHFATETLRGFDPSEFHENWVVCDHKTH